MPNEEQRFPGAGTKGIASRVLLACIASLLAAVSISVAIASDGATGGSTGGSAGGSTCGAPKGSPSGATGGGVIGGGEIGGGETGPHLEIAEDGRSLRSVPADEQPETRYTIEEWHAWAEDNLVEQLGEPVRIGEQEMPPAAFDRFGAVQLAPDGDRVAFTATTYAMLTTISVVGILEIDDRSLQAVNSLRVVKEPVTGGTNGLTWSPDGRYLAYAVDTARASGERLRIDDTRGLVNKLTLDASALLTAAAIEVQDPTFPEARWLPRIRRLSWGGHGRLRFVSDDPRTGDAGRADGASSDEEPGVTWSVSPKTGELRGEFIGR